METLHLHIEYLLTRHDCVILPGLGALIVNETEASIDSARSLIAPRSRFISFNANVVTDDGLLTHSLARREHLTFEEAHRMLSSIIARMRTDLEVEGEVSLGMTGRLLMNSEGLIRFEPRISSFTLQPLALLSVHEAEQADAEAEQDGLQDGMSEDLATDEVSAADDKDYYVIRIPRRAVHAAAMFITILTVAVSLLIPINHDQQQKASVIPIPSPREYVAPATQPADTVISQPESANSHSLSPTCQAKRGISE